MTFDMVMTAIVYSLFLFVWLPWQVIKHRKRSASTKAIVRGYQFYLKYRFIQGTTKNLNAMRRP